MAECDLGGVPSPPDTAECPELSGAPAAQNQVTGPHPTARLAGHGQDRVGPTNRLGSGIGSLDSWH